MVGASLLQSDDDSDVADLDLPRGASSIHRRTFFNKTSNQDYEELRFRRKTLKNMLTIVFAITFFVFAYLLFSALKSIQLINDQLKEIRLENRQIAIIREELRILRFEMSLIKESASTNSSKPSTDLIYEKMRKLSSQIDQLNDRTKKTSTTIEDVTSRISRVEKKCLAVCQQPHDTAVARVGASAAPTREQPRRRQAKEENKLARNGGDEIVFNRND